MNNRIMLVVAVFLAALAGASLAQEPQRDKFALAPKPSTEQTVIAPDTGPPPPVLQTRAPRYRLRPGDVLDLNFSFTPDFNQSVVIQPDGYITLRDLGDVYVQGMTVPELTARLTSSYAGILQHPSISIVLKDFERPHFVVGGEVRTPGKFELRGPTTVTEGVAVAGGFNERAKHSQVLLFRRVSDDWMEVKPLDLKAIYRGDFREDVQLRPGDMLFVPQNTFSKVKFLIPLWAFRIAPEF